MKVPIGQKRIRRVREAPLLQSSLVAGSRIPLPSLLHALGRLDLLIHFTAMDRHFFRSINPQSHFVAPYLDYGNHDIVPDHDALVLLPGQHEHGSASLYG